MATAFTHSIVGAATLYCGPQKYHYGRNYIIAAFLAACADFDIIAFRIGIPYDSLFGHRGFSHSILVAILLGCTAAYLARKSIENSPPSFWGLAGILSLAALSHGLLDAFTNGGHGVAFFAPFINERYFFPTTPIKVCSIGLNFFNPQALEVFKSEFMFVILPTLALVIGCWSFRRLKRVGNFSAESG